MGMICAEDELGIGQSHDGILVLDSDGPATDAGARRFADYLDASEARAGGDAVLDVNVTPNRPDATSHIGVARDVAALTGRPLRAARRRRARGRRRGGFPGDRSTVEDARDAARATPPSSCDGVTVGPSPDWVDAGAAPRPSDCGLINECRGRDQLSCSTSPGSRCTPSTSAALAERRRRGKAGGAGPASALVTLDGVRARRCRPGHARRSADDAALCRRSRASWAAPRLRGAGGRHERASFVESAAMSDAAERCAARLESGSGSRPTPAYRFERGVGPDRADVRRRPGRRARRRDLRHRGRAGDDRRELRPVHAAHGPAPTVASSRAY